MLSVSCTKETENVDPPLVDEQTGSITGTVTIFNKSGTEHFNFGDLKIKLIDSLHTVKVLELNSEGRFMADSIPFGRFILAIDKNGYGVVDTLSFNHQKKADTISTFSLAEELPLSYNSFSVYYGNKMIHYNRSTSYQTTDSYMVGELICFGKGPDVSLNNCSFFMVTGSYSNVSTINWTINSSTSCSLQNFTNNGMQTGDLIFSVCYPIVKAPFTLLTGQEQNFGIVSYKINNPSNVCWFTLNE
jgi:hypothetical protein